MTELGNTKNCNCDEFTTTEFSIIKVSIKKYLNETNDAKELFSDKATREIFQNQIDKAELVLEKVNKCLY